ncbi:MAG: hypothetical protein U5K53_02385 [Halanaerobiales bacterium]|nr:hypothetical protein [Halanaerobiales bacterium]
MKYNNVSRIYLKHQIIDHYFWMNTVPVRRPLFKELYKLVENRDLIRIKVFIDNLLILLPVFYILMSTS